MSAPSQGRILILDRESWETDELARTLEARQYRPVVCRTAQEALALFREKDIDLVIAEWHLDDGEELEGLQFLEMVHKLDPHLSLLVLTAFPDVDSAVRAMKLGARDYLKKPLAPEQILIAVEQALEERRVALNRQDRLTGFEELKRKISASLNLREVLDLIVFGVAQGLGPEIKGSTISLLDKNKGRLKVVAHQGLSPSYLDKGPIASSRSIGEMILRGEYVWISNAAEDPRIQYPEEAQREGIASVLSLPMRIKDQVMGALRIYTRTPREFNPEEIGYLHRFAEQAALAIENARTYEDMKHKYESLRTDLVDFFDDGWT